MANMELVSWNVNGIRAAMDKGFRDYVQCRRPDVLCLQETKAVPEQVDLGWVEALGYRAVWNCAEKRGYSGTLMLTRDCEPANFSLGMAVKTHDREGRVITTEFDDFQLVTVYTPNSQRGLTRLDYRQRWDKAFLSYVRKLRKTKPVIFCGDLNCAHQEIDLANPKQNRRNAGFTDEERQGLSRILDAGFVDSFRSLEPGSGHYTWWTYRSNARQRNIGWRLDYFCVDEALWGAVSGAAILSDVHGSDHCPVNLTLNLGA